MKKRLLLTGASGFLGWNIANIVLQKDLFEVCCLIHRKPLDLPHTTTLNGDLLNPGSISGLLDQVRPDAIIHCAAVSQPNDCENDPVTSRIINVESSEQFAIWAGLNRVPMVFTSTDLVFNGIHPPYSEHAEVSPVNEYGRQKADAEKRILDAHPSAVVCRMPLMFGDPGPAAKSFIQPWIKALHSGETLSLFTDEYRTPIDVLSAAEGILIALQKAHGILHLGGRERISRYLFGLLLVRILGLDESLIKGVLQKDVPMPAARPPDVSLESERAYGLGFNPQPVKEALHKIITSLDGTA